MNSTIEKNLQQAKAIMARPDYAALPQEARNWCEMIVQKYERQGAAVNPGFCCALCGAGFDFGCNCPDW